MAKIGRNEACPCGSGKKYKRCCGRPVIVPDRRLMERDMRAVTQLAQNCGVESVEEINRLLQESARHGGITWEPQTPLEQAQELIYQALEAHDEKARVRLALRALDISPDCADAYNLLAEESADTVEQARDFYQKGVEAGERALGSQPFTEDVGHFWGILETRPYMRAREGLADCLWHLGQREEAIGHYREMLRLNPNDNQGIRYRLLSCLVEIGDAEAAERLLLDYEEDGSAAWLYTRALLTFRREGDSPGAREALREALRQNRHVLPYLTGRRRLPRRLPDYVGIGDADEAVAYVAEFGDFWRRTPGALSWAAATSPGGYG